jgi:inward rectifier potassium channel
MQKPTFDPGLTQKYAGSLRRAINPTGEFNVKRQGTSWRDIHPYLYLIHVRWSVFFALVVAAFLVVNTLFAVAYTIVGLQHLHGADAPTDFEHFMNAFYFSAHTLTTVGYGSIYPQGIAENSVATFEALFGVMGFAVATAVLVGRVSRPSARIGFSEKMIVAPYQEGTSLQFRIVNRRSNSLMELQAQVLLMTVESVGGTLQRKFAPLTLERPGVLFLPLTWTIVHPIDDTSPIRGLTAGDFERLQVEFLILIKGIDDTFGQTVHQRFSYRYDEIAWGGKFVPAFEIGHDGDLVLQMDRVSLLEQPPETSGAKLTS